MISLAKELNYYFRNYGEYGAASLGLAVLRSMRVLWYLRKQKELWELDVYRNYVASVSDGHLLHYLTHREYLIKGLSVGQRIRCVLEHYKFEERTFNSAYRAGVYREGGLSLWCHEAENSRFSINLSLSPRKSTEGELVLTFFSNDKALHYIGFSWVDGNMLAVSEKVVPFIARNQAKLSKDDPNLLAFKAAFPNNTPSFFCFAAMQGVAQALGISAVVGTGSKTHVNYGRGADFERHAEHFANAYEGFWQKVGGVQQTGIGYFIELPFYRKPLSEVAPKHRKQTATRRAYWAKVAEAVRENMKSYVVRDEPALSFWSPSEEANELKRPSFAEKELPESIAGRMHSYPK